MKIILVIVSFLVFSIQQGNKLSDLEFLKGEWKIEAKETYEFWTLEKNGELKGNSYNIIGGQNKITETLALKIIDNQVVYQATVPDQNEGKTISFILNPNEKTCFSFENPNHDFPKKIQYEKVSGNKILIRILGDEGKGFSYKLIRQ